MHGVINLLKPPGMTSHDAVAFVRRALKIKRVGHTGTLDPAAAGVLPICVGQATRLVEYLQAGSKTYIAEATFGFETDTLDGVGEVLSESDASGVTLETIRTALDAFRGEIEQIPPIYSAIKRDGQKLYDLARAGQLDESELQARRVTIYAVHPTRFVAANDQNPRPRAMIRIRCSSGTYIRSLVRDLGRALGCGATMTFLVRTQNGEFALQEAKTLEEIAANPADALLPMNEVLKRCQMPMAKNDEAAFALSQGRYAPAAILEFARPIKNRMMPVKDEDLALFPHVIIENEAGTIATVARPHNTEGGLCYKPEKVLFLDAD